LSVPGVVAGIAALSSSCSTSFIDRVFTEERYNRVWEQLQDEVDDEDGAADANRL